MPKVTGELKSQKRLKESLKELLKEKNLDEITIKELCQKAKCNRTTFYNSYNNLDDLLFSLQKDFFMKMKDYWILYQQGYELTHQEVKNHIHSIIIYFDQHKEEYLLLLKNNNTDLLTVNLSIYTKSIVLPKNYRTEQDYDFIYHFMGVLSVISTWLLEGEPISIDELTEICTK